MTGKTVSHADEHENARVWAAPRPDPAAAAQGLERVREALSRRLDALEGLVAEQAALSDHTPSERERALRDRAAAYEASLSRVQAELKRREQEWEEKLAQLEHDRELLASAWQRLEDDQVQGAAEVEAPRAATPPPPPAPEESNDAVTKAILRQFQTLQGDVRNRAKGRGVR